MTTVTLFVFGAITGSFLNVLSLRLNSGLTFLGRSRCASCGRTLGVSELVPILSFFFLKGRCRGCRSRVSFQYPLTELVTGLVFATVFDFTAPPGMNALALTTFALYIAITIYDFRHQIIPDALVYPAILSAFFYRLLEGGGSLDYLAGPILALAIILLWLISKGRAIGFGDSKLALSIGLLLGAAAGFSSIIIAFWVGAVTGIILILLSRINPLSREGKRFTIKSAVPFAPFMVVGAWLALTLELDLLHVSFF